MSIHGKATGIILGGYDITKMLRQINVSASTEAAEATPFMENDKLYVAGMSDSTATLDGMYDGAKAEVEELFEDAQGQDSGTPVLIVYGGWVPGRRVRVGRTLITGFDISSPVSDIVSISGSIQMDAGARGGWLLGHVTAEDSASGPSVQTATAATDAGGRVQVHVTENERDGDTTIIVQHSSDNSLWVDLQLSEVVAAGELYAAAFEVEGTINRYVRVISLLEAGTGSVSYTAAITRNS